VVSMALVAVVVSMVLRMWSYLVQWGFSGPDGAGPIRAGTPASNRGSRPL
jgi:hypothetical protein